MPDLAQEIRTMVAEIVDISPETIKPDAKFVEDLGVDSMMALEILASLEKKYRIRIPEESLAKLTSLNETVNLAKEMLEKQKASA